MRTRRQELGKANIVGARITKRREELKMKQVDLLTLLQVNGLELTASGLSKLEGQIRSCNDYELVAISKALDVSVEWLLGIKK